MLKINEIKFKNIFSYGNKWETFKFDKGMTYITGENKQTKRRNFTGKSSLLKIIPFVLFGKVDGLTKQQIINWKNKKNAEVIIKFSKGKDNYLIQRGIKPDIFSVIKNDVEMPISSNKKTFQEELEETVLGFNFDTFMNIVYCDTNNMVSILNASKPVKRDYIEKLFNLVYFVDLKKKSDQKKKELNDKLIQLNAEFSSQEENKFSLENQIKSYINDINSLTEKSNKQEEIIKNFVSVEIDIENLTKDKENKEKQLFEMEKEKNKIDLLCSKIKMKIKYLLKKEPKKPDFDTIEDDLKDKIDKLISDYQNIEKVIDSKDIELLQDKLDELSKEKSKIEKQLYEAEINKKNTEKEIHSLEKELKGKPKEGKCPTCMQNVSFDHIKSEYENMIQEKRNKLTEYIPSIENHTTTFKELSIQINDLEKEIIEYNQLKDSLKELNENISVCKQKSIQIEIYEKEKAKFERIKKAINKQKIMYKKLSDNDISKQEEKTQKEIHSLKEQVNTLTQKQKEQNEAKNDLDNTVQQIKLINGYKSTSTKQLKEIKQKIEKSRKTIDHYKISVEYLKEISVLCSDDKCKQYAISSYLPYFNERVNHYLNLCGVKFYLKLYGWLDYDIKGPGIVDAKYSNLSGAERISVDRSIQLASIDIKKSQANELIDLLIFDEVLDSSLDNQGLVDMMSIIKDKQVTEDLKILVVSHKNEMGDLDQIFDKHYLVEFDGYSKIKEGLWL